jgi:hypothetical protein
MYLLRPRAIRMKDLKSILSTRKGKISKIEFIFRPLVIQITQGSRQRKSRE